ncbi:MAG TPA: hypothetical protein ENL03_04855, partial [Phycisphaerae bacterium]|nr:hypothetical protein [Phycisphaerae bacterium]
DVEWEGLCDHIVNHLDEYQQGVQADDVTLLMLRRNLQGSSEI